MLAQAASSPRPRRAEHEAGGGPGGVWFTLVGSIAPLASSLWVAYPCRVVKQPIINVGERIDKVVGRRTNIPDAFESGMKLQSLAVELHRSLKQRWAPKGVYRFKTHEEADEWMNRMLARSQIPRT